MTVVRATAPTRVDLAGGTLDLWPLSQLVDDVVIVNCAIDVMTGCTIETGGSTWRLQPRGLDALELPRLPTRPERHVPGRYQLAAVVAEYFGLPPCRIETWSDAAPGSGLGGSSSLVMSLIAAAARVADRTLSDEEAVSLGCNLETRVLRLPGGNQDHWAAQCGGVSILEYRPEGVRRTAAPQDAAALIARALVVADTAVEHHSGMNNWSVFKAVLDGEPGAASAAAEVAAASTRLSAALLSGATGEDLLARASRALGDEWRARRRLAPAVSSPEVERVVAAAEAAGGAGKVCGAGGGGCVACLPTSLAGRDRLRTAVEATGARVLRAAPMARGVQVD